ncbi:783_t:CDS:2, partial [Scutellospora calospora]
NELTECSFETTDNTINLTESMSTEPIVELTNTSEKTLIQVLDQTKITEKLFRIITNNAFSMLAAERELKLVSLIIKNVRDFVTKIQHSTRLNESLKTIYKLENKPELKSNLDIETQWNNNDWLVVNSLIQLLELFFIATKILSISMYPTISNEYIDEPTAIELYKNDTQLTNINLWSRENKWLFFESLISEQNSEQITVEDEIT